MKKAVFGILVAAVMCLFAVSGKSFAAELSENMTQGQFAQWLVKAVDASRLLPAAASEQDAVDFLTLLNVIPAGGWKNDEKISKKFLASLLGDESAENLDFKTLIERIKAHVLNLFRDVPEGVFRAFGSTASGSVTV